MAGECISRFPRPAESTGASKYRLNAREKRLALGVYPDVTLAHARRKRDEAHAMLADGIDPGQAKKEKKRLARLNAAKFKAVALEWFERQAPAWAPSHSDKVMGRLKKDLFPGLGSCPIADITAPEVLEVLRRAESRGANDTSHRIHQNCGQIFRYAIATGRALRDVTADLRGALRPNRHTHFAFITDPVEVGEMLRELEGFSGTFVVGAALRLAPLLFARPGELRQAEWSQFDLERREWRYTVSKTKTQHLVPLATQVVEILRELHGLTGRWRFVFPGRDRRKPMSTAAINAALQRLGFNTKTEITGHGFRAMARTILHERLRFPPEVIEHQLAHRVPDTLGVTYNRTRFLDARVEMMQAWADYLDRLKAGTDIVAADVNRSDVAETLKDVRGGSDRCSLEAFVTESDLHSALLRETPFLDSYLAVVKVLHLLASTLTAAHRAELIRREPELANVLITADHTN